MESYKKHFHVAKKKTPFANPDATLCFHFLTTHIENATTSVSLFQFSLLPVQLCPIDLLPPGHHFKTGFYSQCLCVGCARTQKVMQFWPLLLAVCVEIRQNPLFTSPNSGSTLAREWFKLRWLCAQYKEITMLVCILIFRKSVLQVEWTLPYIKLCTRSSLEKRRFQECFIRCSLFLETSNILLQCILFTKM